MKIGVCLKVVPSTASRIKVADESSGVDTTDLKWEMNPYDAFALEEALIAKKNGNASEVIAFTIAGAHPGSSVIATGADGTAVLSYRGSRVGEDTVTVSADVDRNGTADLSSAVSVTWEDRYGMVLAPEVHSLAG